jgi:hypothetical protein
MIVRAVRRGDIEVALNDLKERFADVLARDGGIMRLKLRCRQFVELVNAAAEAKRAFSASTSSHNGAQDVDAMDVDDDAPAQAALKAALLYGRTLRTDYKKEADERPEVHALLERTWSVIAYHFPAEAGGEVGRWAGQDARDALAGEVNQAILGARLYDLSACSTVLMVPRFPPPLFHTLGFLRRIPRIPKATGARAYISADQRKSCPARFPRCQHGGFCGPATRTVGVVSVDLSTRPHDTRDRRSDYGKPSLSTHLYFYFWAYALACMLRFLLKPHPVPLVRGTHIVR